MPRKRRNNLSAIEIWAMGCTVQVYNEHGLVGEFGIDGKRESGALALTGRQKGDATASRLLFLLRVICTMLEMRVKRDLENGSFYVAPGRSVPEGQFSLPFEDEKLGEAEPEDSLPNAIEE